MRIRTKQSDTSDTSMAKTELDQCIKFDFGYAEDCATNNIVVNFHEFWGKDF